jgi:hypothetical protein
MRPVAGIGQRLLIGRQCSRGLLLEVLRRGEIVADMPPPVLRIAAMRGSATLATSR